jgi:formylglycine-generating enzyme required for sulfatase activity
MSGNVDEWTRSAWRASYAEGEGEESSQALRVVRGGAFINTSGFVRSAARDRLYLGSWSGDLGFRVVLSPFPL